MITAYQNGSGNGTVTAGTPVSVGSLASVQVTSKSVRIIVTALDSNNGTLVVGDHTVIASPSSARKGVPLLPTFSQVFNVSSLNQIWVDATNTGDGFTFYYEFGS